MATQKYIAFLDADDAWHHQKIEVQLKIMAKNPQISISGHTYTNIEDDPNYVHATFITEYFKRIEVIGIKNTKMLLSNQLPTSSVMLKRWEVDQRFHSRKYHSEDYLLWLTIMLLGHKAVKINMPLYYIYDENSRCGLSKRLWRMQRGEAETYRILWMNGLIGFFLLMLLGTLSFMKYIKRLILEIAIRTLRGFNKG